MTAPMSDVRQAERLHAPFPWFGGKRRVADVVWRAFGPEVPNYVEPFYGSGAVLLGRPGGAGKIETANDRDRYVANFWRAVSADPQSVARHADWPVNEADLHARHKWLHDQVAFRERMHTDPDYFDVKIAGWWVWGLCQWIGGGWCTEPRNHKHPRFDGMGKGVHADHGHGKRQIPSNRRTGVHADAGNRRASASQWRQRPSTEAMGVHALTLPGGGGEVRKFPKNRPGGVHGEGLVNPRKTGRRPAMTSAGQGVHLPSLGNDRGINGVAAIPCEAWFLELQARLRRVRFACGDWKRVLGQSVLGKGENVGGRRPCAIFFDPPYSHELRDPYLYNEDDAKISDAVRGWCLEHGDDPELRIALCGYAGEHPMPATWTEHAWVAARGYSGMGNDNRLKERIWFSPHCLPLQPKQPSLFDAVAGGPR